MDMSDGGTVGFGMYKINIYKNLSDLIIQSPLSVYCSYGLIKFTYTRGNLFFSLFY